MSFTLGIYLLSFFILCIPTTRFSILDGIPLQQPFEVAFFTVWLFSFSLFLLNAFRMGSPTKKIGDSKKGVTVLLVLLLFKFFMLFAPDHAGFSRCYSSKESKDCWFSTNNILKFNQASEVLPFIDWDSEKAKNRWDKNDLRLVKQTGSKVTYQGRLSAETLTLQLVYQGEVTVRYGDVIKILKNNHVQTEPVLLSDLPSPLLFEVSAPLDTPSKFRLERDGKLALSFEDKGTLFYWVNKALSFATLGVLFFWFLVFFTHVVQSLSLDIKLFVFTLILCSLIFYFSPLVGLRVLLPGAFLLATCRKKQLNLANWFLVFLLCISAFVFKFTNGEVLSLRQVGDDPLTHETFSRQILEDRSLRAGEDVFFFQPGFRYYQSAIYFLFGENNSLSLVFNLFVLFFSAFLLFVSLDRKGGSLPSKIASVAILVLLAGPGSYNLVANLSEYVAWIFVLFAMGLILSSHEFRFYFIPLFLSYAALVRPNQMPGLFMVLLLWVCWFYRKNRGALLAVGIFISMQFLPFLHNAYYGKTFAFLPKSALDQKALVYTLPPSELVHLFTSEKVRSTLLFQIRHMGILGSLQVPLHWLNRIAFNLIALVFFFTLFKFWRKKERLVAAALALTAAPFFLIHLFVDTSNYFPRHQIGPYLILALLICFSQFAEKSRA